MSAGFASRIEFPALARAADGTAATAVLAAADVQGAEVAVETGGWNIATAYQCSDLKVSPADARAGESLTVFATVGETFLDGSRVTLYVDGRPAESQCVWARGDRKTGVEFALRLPAGKHELRVGDSKVSVVVR